MAAGRRQPRRKREEPPSGSFLLPEVPLTQLEDILHEVSATVSRLPASPESHALRLRTQQARMAITACAKDDFGRALRSALTAKVLDIETRALVAERMEYERRAAAGDRRPKRRGAR